jgi:hypothetical protein
VTPSKTKQSHLCRPEQKSEPFPKRLMT